MNDEAEASSSSSRRRDGDQRAANPDPDDTYEEGDAEETARAQELTAKERRLDAKRKRIVLLDQLLKDLDSLAFVELITIYYLEHVHPCNLSTVRIC